ncbi:UDP-galactopyranose mutase [Rhodanobacter lindaniclasticus]
MREPREPVLSSEDVVLNSVGRDLYEKSPHPTRKQWGLDPSQLKAGVAARIPVRTNTDDRHFTDTFQAMPLHGYTKMFETMLHHRTSWWKWMWILPRCASAVVTTTSSHRPDRRVFRFPLLATCPTVRCASSMSTWRACRSIRTGTITTRTIRRTRITEFKHLTGQRHGGTSIVREYPQAEGDPYYPVPRAENEALFKRYEELARQEPNVTFVGRLAQYRYYNMDQVVGAALVAAKRLLGRGEDI